MQDFLETFGNPGAGGLGRHFSRARKKPVNINILGGTVSGTNRNRPWDKGDPFLAQTGLFPLNLSRHEHVKLDATSRWHCESLTWLKAEEQKECEPLTDCLLGP